MRNTQVEMVPKSFLTDLTPEAFDELVEQIDFLLAPCPEVHPYGSQLPELPKDWGVVEEVAS